MTVLSLLYPKVNLTEKPRLKQKNLIPFSKEETFIYMCKLRHTLKAFLIIVNVPAFPPVLSQVSNIVF